MLAYADRDALARTLSTGQAHYYSRSRRAPWRKGETSGHVQRVVEVRLDCDGDAVLYRVDQTGPACHTGERTCFSTVLSEGEPVPGADPGGHPLSRLPTTIARRAEARPDRSYTVQLLDRGVAKIAQKVGRRRSRPWSRPPPRTRLASLPRRPICCTISSSCFTPAGCRW